VATKRKPQVKKSPVPKRVTPKPWEVVRQWEPAGNVVIRATGIRRPSAVVSGPADRLTEAWFNWHTTVAKASADATERFDRELGSQPHDLRLATNARLIMGMIFNLTSFKLDDHARIQGVYERVLSPVHCDEPNQQAWREVARIVEDHAKELRSDPSYKNGMSVTLHACLLLGNISGRFRPLFHCAKEVALLLAKLEPSQKHRKAGASERATTGVLRKLYKLCGHAISEKTMWRRLYGDE
jgi:hypothetical protein